MTDAVAFVQNQGFEEAAAALARPNRPAKPHEIRMVHARLLEAIDASEFYCEEFKAYEKSRLTRAHLRNLMAVDPRHVLIALDHGTPVGLQITGPELGTLWLYWSYMFPEARKHANAMRYLPALINLWNNDRFHKIATYTKPDNRVAIALSKRAKFEHVSTIKQHMFGEDYMLFEHPLTRAKTAYDKGMGLTPLQRLKCRLFAEIGL